jgi:hypothetical protein
MISSKAVGTLLEMGGTMSDGVSQAVRQESSIARPETYEVGEEQLVLL